MREPQDSTTRRQLSTNGGLLSTSKEILSTYFSPVSTYFSSFPAAELTEVETVDRVSTYFWRALIAQGRFSTWLARVGTAETVSVLC